MIIHKNIIKQAFLFHIFSQSYVFFPEQIFTKALGAREGIGPRGTHGVRHLEIHLPPRRNMARQKKGNIGKRYVVLGDVNGISLNKM